MHWKWSIGGSDADVPKSARQKKTVDTTYTYTGNYNSQLNAISQSLADDFTKTGSREELDSKISERDKIAQRGVNPFLQTSYTNDIMAHDLFLKPVNTTMGRIKEPVTNN